MKLCSKFKLSTTFHSWVTNSEETDGQTHIRSAMQYPSGRTASYNRWSDWNGCQISLIYSSPREDGEGELSERT